MSGRLIEVTASAYQFPLLIKHLLHSSMLHAADQEIVYRDQKRLHLSHAGRPHRSFGERAE